MGLHLDGPPEPAKVTHRSLADIYGAADVPLWNDVHPGKGSPRNKEGQECLSGRFVQVLRCLFWSAFTAADPTTGTRTPPRSSRAGRPAADGPAAGFPVHKPAHNQGVK